MSFRRYFLIVPAVMVASTVRAITLEDYVDPNSTYENAYALGSFVMQNENYNRQPLTDNELATTIPQSSYDLNLSSNYRRVYSSLPLAWTYSGEIVGQLTQSPTRPLGTSESSSSNESLLAIFEGNYDRYLQSNPNVFWFGSGSLDFNSELDDPRAVVGGGVGYGRVINATPLAKALRVMEDFQRFSLLTAYPSDVVMMEIAQIINKEEEYESKYGSDEYRRVWYEAIETVLMGGGLINGDGLGALGVIKLDDVLNRELINAREHGWRAAAGVNYEFRDYDGSSGDKGLSLSFRYAKPYGYKGQLIEDVSFSRTLGGDGDTTLLNKLSYTYEVSDVVDWQNTWTLSLINSDVDNTTNDFSSSFFYEINNVLTFDITLNLLDSDSDNVDGVRSRMTTGIRYRLR